jgi:putative hemolysin
MTETPRERRLATDDQLGLTSAQSRGLRARLLRLVERMSGLERVRPQYEIWQRDIAAKHPRMFNVGLDMLRTRLAIDAPRWPIEIEPARPLVMLCNHPFGIGDGIAALALAEDLQRPFRVLLNKEFMRVPEVQPFALPIDFADTREAVATNLRTRNAARELMQQGVTMIVFPAGSVATARRPWGRAEELPWKLFAARLVQESAASILPVWFEGQNSALFHAASHVSASLRMSLLVAEFRRFVEQCITVRIGEVTPFEQLSGREDRKQLLNELYLRVHRLSPQFAAMPDEAILARQSSPAWKLDSPVSSKRRG